MDVERRTRFDHRVRLLERRGERLDRLHGVEIAASPEAEAEGADAVVIVTEWSQLAAVDWAAVGATMRTRLLIDGRNMLDPAALRAGFAYEGIGRAADRAANG